MNEYRIYLGDNLEILKAKQEAWRGKFQCIFSDPPYFLSSFRSKQYEVTTEFRKKGITLFKGDWDMVPKGQDHTDYVIKHSMKWLKLCQNLLTDNGTIFVCGMTQFNLYGVVYAMRKIGYWILNNIYVYKPNAVPNIRGVRFSAAVDEMIWAKKTEDNPYLFNYKIMKHYNGGKQMRNMWVINNEGFKYHGTAAKHRTPKPLEQVKRALLAATNKDDWVLDPFLGTGTTMSVAKKLRRNCIGIEIDRSYLPLIRQRVGWNDTSLMNDIKYKLVSKWKRT
jgi:DNA modification methylase